MERSTSSCTNSEMRKCICKFGNVVRGCKNKQRRIGSSIKHENESFWQKHRNEKEMRRTVCKFGNVTSPKSLYGGGPNKTRSVDRNIKNLKKNGKNNGKNPRNTHPRNQNTRRQPPRNEASTNGRRANNKKKRPRRPSVDGETKDKRQRNTNQNRPHRQTRQTCRFF